MPDFRTYRGRFLETAISRALLDTRVVAIVGPRQAGKSTLARHVSGNGGGYYTFDDLATLAAADADPGAFIRSLPIGSVIDEVQRLPRILQTMQLIVDSDPTPGRLLLIGSTNLLAVPNLSESLAGRMELFTLLPFAQAEIANATGNFVDALFDPKASSSL